VVNNLSKSHDVIYGWSRWLVTTNNDEQ